MANYSYVSKRTATCTKCGRACLPREDGLCGRCRDTRRQIESDRFKTANLPRQRKCHDCGRPTSDYRCPACWAKLRREHGLPFEDRALASLDEDFCYV